MGTKLLNRSIKDERSLREDQDPCARRFEPQQPRCSVPFIALIELQVFKVDVSKHPASAKQGANRAKDKLRDENHDDLPVCHLHKPRRFVSSLGVVALYFGVVPSVDDAAENVLGVLERHSSQ